MMDRKAFKKEVKRKLKGLEKEQVATFAWRCAVRALPFLGGKGHFDFWKEEADHHLYVLLKALDVSRAVQFSQYLDAAARSAASAAADAAYAADAASAAADAASAAYAADAAADAADAAADAASAAAAAYAAYAAASAADAASAAAAAYAAYAAASAADATAYFGMRGQMIQTLLSDIDQVKQGAIVKGDVSMYGAVWPQFMQALEGIDCAYWGRLYKNIIESGFQLNEEALMRRLNVPNEIQQQGAAAVARNLERMEREGARRLNEARIIILGDKGSGKTCVARRLVNPEAPMTTSEESTPGVETMLWELPEEGMNVRIWDFAGHTVTHAVHRFFLSERCLYVLVLNGREDAKNLEYWLDHTTNYGGASQTIIMVNRRGPHKVNIPINTLKNKYRGLQGVYEFSVRDDQKKLTSFRTDLRTLVSNNPSWAQQQIPESYYHVKEALEEIFVSGDAEKGEEHITKERFMAIAAQCGAEEPTELLKDLHHLGVSLWYEGLGDFNTLVLNPEWISHGVYHIVNWLSNQEKYTLNKEADYPKIFESNAARYPESQYAFLSKLMCYYELAFETEGKKALILPHLMNEDQPAWLPDFSVWEDLMLRYESLQPLPPNVVSRFIVRHHLQIKKRYTKKLVWRHGVVLQDAEGNVAMVIEEDRHITVSVTGKTKAAFLDNIRKTLNAIFESYKVQKPELQYQVRRMGESQQPFQQAQPMLVSEGEILRHHKNHRDLYDSLQNKDIPTADVINLYQIQGDAHFKQGDEYTDDHSVHNEFHIEFKECNVSLQGSLSTLARKLAKVDKEEAEDVQEVVEALQEAKACESPEAAKEKGLDKVLGGWMRDLADEDSKLHKTVQGIKKGAGIAQDIAAEYNKVAQWLGMPQVPKPFLKSEG